MSKKNSTFAVALCARSRSAIEAHRTRLASWKRSMPPLSPKITDFRGPRTLESYGEADRSTEGR